MADPLRQFAPLRPYLRPYLRGFALGCGALALASAFQLAAPLVLRDAIDSLRRPDPAHSLLAYAGLFAALALAQAVSKFFSRRVFLGGGRRVEHDLRAAYFARLIRLPTARLETGRKGDFVSRATHDLQDIRLFLGAGVMNFLQTLILLVVATVLLCRIHPLLTLAALAPFPAISILVRRFSPRFHRRYREANERAGDLSAMVQEGLAGIWVVRAYHRERWQAQRFETANRALRDAEVKVVRAWAVLFPLVGVLAGLGHIAVLGFGGLLVARGTLTLGDFVAFNTYLAMLTWPMVALGWTLSLVQRGSAALGRIQEVLADPEDPAGFEPLAAREGPCLRARGVRFRHDGARADLLSGVDLALSQGSFWGLVGATAAGKSTLASLLTRLRRPTVGSIELHGQPLDAVAQASLRAHLAAVPQSGFFFADTVAANVYLGRERDPDRLAWALEVAGLSDEVAQMPHGVDSKVGEGGVTLSGGQRQRLAIARALYGRPRALVLDSALSSLDTETARRVLGGLRRALPEATLLVVSHRGTEVDGADGVLFLAGGRIVARGRHRELLETVPEYLALYREEELRRELEEARA